VEVIGGDAILKKGTGGMATIVDPWQWPHLFPSSLRANAQ